MCDYSLHHVKARPAKVGDKLTARDFGLDLATLSALWRFLGYKQSRARLIPMSASNSAQAFHRRSHQVCLALG